jgi:hypothetical protein
MGQELAAMSTREFDRLEVIRRVVERSLTQTKAAELMGLSERQVRHLGIAYAERGAAGLVSGKRGMPSNRRLPAELKSKAIAIVRELYADFGPKLAYQPRHRRECLGELVQIDGCEHAWFEEHGPVCTLLVYVDDATGRIMELRLLRGHRVVSQAPRQAGGLLQRQAQHLSRRPRGRDGTLPWRHAVRARLGSAQYRHYLRENASGEGPRRAHEQDPPGQTGQGVAPSKVSDMEAGNAFLPEFIEDYNLRSRAPRRTRTTRTGHCAPMRT